MKLPSARTSNRSVSSKMSYSEQWRKLGRNFRRRSNVSSRVRQLTMRGAYTAVPLVSCGGQSVLSYLQLRRAVVQRQQHPARTQRAVQPARDRLAGPLVALVELLGAEWFSQLDLRCSRCRKKLIIINLLLL